MNKEFFPWKPGDAYNSLNDITPAYHDQYQYRVWNDRHNKWFYYDKPGNHQEGNTGSVVVYILILILWLFAAYRFWLVWAYKLNFDEPGPKGIDFLQWWSREKFRGMTCFICQSERDLMERNENVQEDDTRIHYSKRILSLCRQSRSFEKYDLEIQSQGSTENISSNTKKYFANISQHGSRITVV